MDRIAQQQHRIRELQFALAGSYVKIMKRLFRHKPDKYECFLHIMREYKCNRISTPDVLIWVSNLFSDYPALLEGFCNYLPYSKFTEDGDEYGDMEMIRSAKKTKIEDMEFDRPSKRARIGDDVATPRLESISSLNPITTFPTHYSHPMHSSCASGSSSHACEENNTEPDDAENMKLIRLKKNFAYIAEMDPTLVDRPAVYQNFIELIQEIKENRNIFNTMKRATDLLQGYPELHERFAKLLPAGYRMKDIPIDCEMSTD